MNKNILFQLVVFSVISSFSMAQTPSLNWVNQTGASNAVAAMDIESDASGNTYVTGFFSGTIDLDPGPGVVNIQTVGSSDIYLAKYDPQGQLIWGRAFGSSGADEGLHIDVTGNSVVICGFFLTFVEFDSIHPAGFLNSFGDFDAFMAKFDTSGSFVWAKQVGGFAGIEEARSVCQDQLGNVYVTGFFTGQADMDPSNVSLLIPSIGGQDVWIMKLDQNGQLVWVKTLGGVSADQANEIVLDGYGHVLVGGSFRATVDMNPGAGTVNKISAGSDDAFVLKLDTSGQYVWSAAFGGIGTDIMNSVATDFNGNMILAGFFQITMDADPGSGSFLISTSGNVGGFVLKLDSAGTFMFANVFGGTNNNSPRQVKVHPNGHILVAGSFSGTCDFDPSVAVFNKSSQGSDDAYCLRLDENGSLNWVFTYGGSGFEDAQGVSIRSGQELALTGRFSSATDFDPSFALLTLSPAASRDAYVLVLTDQFASGLISETFTEPLASVYPNPVIDELFILPLLNSEVSAKLMSVNGEDVDQFIIPAGESYQHTMRGLRPGVYILELSNKTVRQTYRVVRL